MDAHPDLGRGPSDLYQTSAVQMLPPKDCRLPSSTAEGRGSARAREAELLRLDPILRRVSWVLLPLCFLAGVFNYLDRTNLSFAALELNADLGFTPVDFGLGSGLFYLGYGVAMVPSTFMTMKYGARWYAFITVAWGVVATLSALMSTRTGLFALRLLLGLTEAGFVPSAFHLMSQFYPADRIAKPYAFVSISWQLSSTFAAPLAAGIMSLRDIGGLKGWQWLFILEGIPSVMLGVAMFIWMPSQPLTAKFLTREEGEFVHHQVHGNDAHEARQPLVWRQLWTLVWDSARRLVLWYCIVLAFLWAMAMFSLVSWLPIIIKNMLSGTALSQSTSTGGGGGAARNTQAALLSGVPYLCAAACSLLNAWSADRFSELWIKELHVAIPGAIGGIFLACFTPLYKVSFAAGFAVLVIAMTGAYSGQGIMFARVAALLDTKHVGIGLAIFNAVSASLGGLGGPAIVGAIVQRLGSFSYATIITGIFLAVSALGVAFVHVVERLLDSRWRRRSGQASFEQLPSFAAGSQPGVELQGVAACASKDV